MALIIILMIIVPMETEESKISPDPNVESKSDLTIWISEKFKKVLDKKINKISFLLNK